MTSTRRTRKPPRHDYLPGFGHDLLLPLYDSVQKWLGVPELHRRLIGLAGLDTSRRTLDVGCGTGNLTILAKQLHPTTELVGIDPDPRALARASRKAGHTMAVQFDHGYGQELPYSDASFDRVLSALMFHHLERGVKHRMLTESLRVLTPDSALYLVDFGGRVTTSDGLMARVQLQSRRLRDNIGDGIPTLLRGAGFSEVTELTHRTGWIGRATFYAAFAPASRAAQRE